MIEAETAESVSLCIPRHFGNYTAGRVIGQGSTCAVVEATDRSTGQVYAVKVMSTSNLEDCGIKSKVETELAILGRVSHKHVIQFREFISDNTLLFVVTENCTGGDLLTWILDGRTTQSATLKRLFFEVCIGVQYLHHQGIAHNDLKPENVIIDANGTAKLIDFGYAKTNTLAGDDEKSGSLMYAAPELFTHGWYQTQKADIWSLGIVLYVMATASFPFGGRSDREISHQILKGHLSYPYEMDKQIMDFVKRMTKVNPNERPTIDEVLEDSFFEDVKARDEKKTAEVESGLSLTTAESEMDADVW
jgi:serine/threonine protein kinase